MVAQDGHHHGGITDLLPFPTTLMRMPLRSYSTTVCPSLESLRNVVVLYQLILVRNLSIVVCVSHGFCSAKPHFLQSQHLRILTTILTQLSVVWSTEDVQLHGEYISRSIPPSEWQLLSRITYIRTATRCHYLSNYRTM